jgi:anti-sigma B factor antagonist
MNRFPEGQRMSISERQVGSATVLEVAGAMVAGRIDGLIEAVVRRQVRAGRRIVVVNLRNVFSMDAAGLGALIVGYTTMRDEGGVLRLACLPKRIQHLIAITRLITVFDIFDSIEQAVGKEAVQTV